MRTNIVRILVALAMISSLVGIAVAPAVAQQDPDCDCGPGEVGVELTSYQGPVGSAITVTVTCANDGQPVTVEFDGVGVTTSPSTVTVGDEVATQASCQIQIPAAITGEHTITVNVGFDK